MIELAEPRYPTVNARKGHYESWYLKAAEPGGDRAIWIRYTVHKRPGFAPEGSIWFTFFDRGAPRPYAVKVTTKEIEPASASAFIALGALGHFSPDRALGTVEAAGRRASWELAIENRAAELLHLPERLYRYPLPKTKLLTVSPEAIFSGTVVVNGESIEVEGWPGMVGHNWGSQHAEEWVWLHGVDFEGFGQDSWIDLAFGRVRIGPWTTPWVANGAISLGGQRHALGGIGAVRSTRVDPSVGSFEFSLLGDEVTVSGRASAPGKDTVAWIYADPDQSTHHTLNCSLSSLELSVDPDRGSSQRVETRSGATYEYGSRSTGHGIEVEPFGDG